MANFYRWGCDNCPFRLKNKCRHPSCKDKITIAKDCFPQKCPHIKSKKKLFYHSKNSFLKGGEETKKEYSLCFKKEQELLKKYFNGWFRILSIKEINYIYKRLYNILKLPEVHSKIKKLDNDNISAQYHRPNIICFSSIFDCDEMLALHEFAHHIAENTYFMDRFTTTHNKMFHGTGFLMA